MNYETIGIVGAGQMGAGIAQVCAAAGLMVVLSDVDESALERGRERLLAGYDSLVSKQKMTAGDVAEAMARVETTSQLAALGACDVVIEAATENVRIKCQLLPELDAIAKPGAIIATNTSSVSITQLAATLADPSRFVGMHFFNPVPAMALVEIIRGMQTSDATFETTVALAERLGKSAIQVKNAPGFVVNRILVPMINEAVFALQEGLASAEEIDAGMQLGARHPMGPLALADLIGLDTVLAIMEVIQREMGDTKYRPASLLKEMVDAGYLGRKAKRGFYSY
ncbi:3-hydroxybutyryl-CoA dehydrogenase [Trinickia sp. Y13]|uniref:3-hydroxybutyryl-CoA dehydrogenase n=1 Tax=Trinickia sp. Y13 TaxID=2917807 RepID=UPI002406EB65|nr:3-hydroxybutyryl-CoA dehydrogenase [Trinickia sp. Y13]MDG0023830.1 3-hydroxybutyryl-CoA dehydrogenase [Trinickia sp. Y13]